MSSEALPIAFFGLPLGALALTHAGFAPRVIVLGHTDAPGTRRVRRVLGRRSLILMKPDLDDPDVLRAIASVEAAAILSWFYPRRIPESVLRLAPRGAFGAHPSLLPRWRGPDPYFWALYTGDPETGVSLHRLEREYDTGAVVTQLRVAIGPRDDAWRLAKRLDRPGLTLLIDCARRLAAGEALTGTAQDDALASRAPAPDDAVLSIDWRRPTDEVVRLVRAAAPFPGAIAELGDQQVELIGAETYKAALPRALEASEAVWTPEGLVIRAGDGGVLVTRVRQSDGRVLRGSELTSLFPRGLARVGFAPGAPRSAP